MTRFSLYWKAIEQKHKMKICILPNHVILANTQAILHLTASMCSQVGNIVFRAHKTSQNSPPQQLVLLHVYEVAYLLTITNHKWNHSALCFFPLFTTTTYSVQSYPYLCRIETRFLIIYMVKNVVDTALFFIVFSMTSSLLYLLYALVLSYALLEPRSIRNNYSTFTR